MTYDELRYHEVRQKSIHNCFQRREGVLDQIVYWRARSLEVDIRKDKRVSGKRIGVGGKKVSRGFPKLDGDWYVYHEEWDADTTVEHLSGFLRLCGSMHRAMPKHEVFTLFLDAKDSFHTTSGASQSAERLDDLLTDTLGAGSLFRPQDLLDRARNVANKQRAAPPIDLPDAVDRFGWPTLAELRGRFIIVLTGPDNRLRTYTKPASSLDRVAFVSLGIGSGEPVPSAPHAVFYNMNGDHVGRAAEVPHGCVSRAYYIDDERKWAQAVKAGCHHIATNKVNTAVDAWARTDGLNGFPFQAMDGTQPDQSEDAPVCAVWARSDDLWEESDSFYFHYRICPPGGRGNRYDFYVAGANSHCEDNQKGGVLARESLDPGAPYFGIFRFGQKTGLRVQYRVAAGKTTMTDSLAEQAGFEADTLGFVRLELTDGARTAKAYGSVDGSEWIAICSVDFKKPLAVQGLGVSAHEDRNGAKFLFGVPAGSPDPGFDRKLLIGPNRGHRFKGGCDWDTDLRWRVKDFG